MFSIPYTFSDENESYITLPALKRFAKERRNEDLKTTVDRPELISDIENFANQSDENKEVILSWLDSVLKEGIKDVQIKLFELEMFQIEFFKDDEYIKGIFENLLFSKENRHLCNLYDNVLRFYRYDIIESDCGKIISIYMGKLISTYDKKNGVQVSLYPIVVDVYIDKQIIVARAKSKSGMFDYMEDFDLEKAHSTYVEKELKKVIALVAEKLSLHIKKSSDAYDDFRGKLYRMLDKYTKTPKEVEELIQNKQTDIVSIKDNVMNNICNLSISYEEDVMSDINNMVEKYFSINYPDKKIFTMDRDAYPLKISATDEEDSKVEQTAAMEEPLQSKAIFFDNKKMLQKSKLCDGVYFRFLRLDSKYCSKEFNVKIMTKNDFCTLKFTEYTMEEDIIHVLFSLIDA